MSVPNSMRVGPFCASVLVKKKYMILYIFLIWLTFLPALLEMWWYWQMLWNETRPIHFYIFLPLFLFVIYLSMVFSAIIFAKILLAVINVFHKPREGVFLRDPSDKDYRFKR